MLPSGNIAPGRRSCTADHPVPRRRDSEEIAPPLARAGDGIPWPNHPHPHTVRPERRWAPVADVGPGCTPVCWRWAYRSLRTVPTPWTVHHRQHVKWCTGRAIAVDQPEATPPAGQHFVHRPNPQHVPTRQQLSDALELPSWLSTISTNSAAVNHSVVIRFTAMNCPNSSSEGVCGGNTTSFDPLSKLPQISKVAASKEAAPIARSTSPALNPA